MSPWHKMYIWFRQWTFPAEFRIAAPSMDAWLPTLMQTLTTWTAPPLPLSPPPAPLAPPPPAGLPLAFVVPLCNGHFRMRRNMAQLVAEKKDTQAIRVLGRVLEDMDFLLAEHGIDSRDLKGEVYDEGREDFEPIGAPEKLPGLKRKEIALCESPRIMIHDKVIQKARGIVAIPA